MKNYRLFLLAFAIVSFVLLTGFGRQSPANELTKDQSRSKARSVQIKLTRPVSGTKNKAAGHAPQVKSLDLSVPFKTLENAWIKNNPNNQPQREPSTLFAAQKKKPRSLDLDGEMLMSQEPEMDKQKSVDGAGIVITLKR